jgi:hypothetical protein
MRFRALIQRSPWVRGVCLVLLLIFVLICGIHVGGFHHDSDGDGLGLVDRLATILFVALMGLVLVALTKEKNPLCANDSFGRLELFLSRAVPISPFRMVVPLRC